MFTGREYDEETGLYYYRARYYSPALGRFLQRDPIGYWADFNLYRYCWNNPIVGIDPWGLEAKVSLGKDGNVTVEIPITYKGTGASKEVIDKFNKAIEETWSGQYGKYNVNVKATSPAQGEVGNVIEVPKGNWRAYVIGSSQGKWPAERPGWTAAHEAGHLMGLPDYYDIKTNRPLKGWENNIMAVQGGKVAERNITEILDKKKLLPIEKKQEPKFGKTKYK